MIAKTPWFALLLTVSLPLAAQTDEGVTHELTLEEAGLGIAGIEKTVVEKLTGAVAIKDNVKLTDRASQKNKADARSYLKQVWKELGLEPQSHAYSGGENVYAILKSDPASEEYIVLGAHYDTVSRCPGANDNATGVAVVTGLAAEFCKSKPKSKNLIFVAFDQEEVGLKGSDAFARKIKSDSLKVHSVHTFDQIGWDSNRNKAIELEIPYKGADALYKNAAKALPGNITVKTTSESGSDHTSFRKLGFQAVGITEEYRSGDTTPHMHKSSDTASTVDYSYLESTTKLAVEVVKSLTQKYED